jgi:general secretion pathway protein C
MMTAVVWLLVAASGFAWARRMGQKLPGAPAQTVTSQADAAPMAGAAELLRLLGATGDGSSPAAAPPSEGARYALLGVIADAGGHGRGVALIAIDRQAARAFRVGARVDGDLLLQSVGTRTVSLGTQQGAALLTLALPSPSVLPVPAAAGLPSVRQAAPGEMVEPGRRLRLQSRGAGQGPAAP